MPRSSEKTLSAIHQAGFHLFHKRGFARVSMDDIATAAGVTKRALYYHYDSKDALVGAVLTQQLSHSLRSIRQWGEPKPDSLSGLIESIFSQLITWAQSPNWTGSGFTRLAVELADMPGHPVRKAGSKHKAEIEVWLQKELERLEAKTPTADARALCLLIEGATLLTLIHNDTSYMTDGLRAAQRLIDTT